MRMTPRRLQSVEEEVLRYQMAKDPRLGKAIWAFSPLGVWWKIYDGTRYRADRIIHACCVTAWAAEEARKKGTNRAMRRVKKPKEAA